VTVLEAYPFIANAFSLIRQEQGGQYVVCDCPLRNHRTSRLRLWLGTDGRLMFGCYACGKGAKLDILRAAGLSWKDCFPEGTKIERQHQEVTAKYPYRDESGALLYLTLRLEPGRNGRDKEFSQRRPNPAYDPKRSFGPDNRRWLASLGDVRRVLYRLPELLGADPARPVFVCEGEKDADTLRRLGLVATTAVCGASSEWLESYSLALACRHVVVIEDADEPGRRHANEVLGSVVRHARTACAVRLPAKDATAFLLETRRKLEGSLLPASDDDVLTEFKLACEAKPAYRACLPHECWQWL
jgi:hypothetical protein